MAAERVRVLLDHLAAGLSIREAALAAGVSKSFACNVHRKMGGVYRPPETTYSHGYLDREERYEIARLRESGLPVRQVAERLGRSPSTICRELARNRDPRTGGYLPERADRMAWERQRRPKPSRLSQDPVLRQAVQRLLDRRYSPQQASGRLKVLHPGDPAMRVSRESICQSIYLYPRGSSSGSCRPACTPAAACGSAAGPAAAAAARSPMRSRSASGPPRSKAGWSPATTKAT
jgi:IS30 family transposase